MDSRIAPDSILHRHVDPSHTDDCDTLRSRESIRLECSSFSPYCTLNVDHLWISRASYFCTCGDESKWRKKSVELMWIELTLNGIVDRRTWAIDRWLWRPFWKWHFSRQPFGYRHRSAPQRTRPHLLGLLEWFSGWRPIDPLRWWCLALRAAHRNCSTWWWDLCENMNIAKINENLIKSGKWCTHLSARIARSRLFADGLFKSRWIKCICGWFMCFNGDVSIAFVATVMRRNNN